MPVSKPESIVRAGYMEKSIGSMTGSITLSTSFVIRISMTGGAKSVSREESHIR